MKSFRFLFSLLGASIALSFTYALGQEAPPPPEATSVPPSVEAAPVAPVAPQSAVASPDAPRTAPPQARRTSGASSRGRHDRTITKWGSDAVLPAGEEADNVVALFGSVYADGRVHQNAVSIFGPLCLSETGSSGDNVVAVLGSVRVNGPVRGNVVSVLGGVELGPKARVDGNVVSVGAPIHADPEAIVRGDVVEAASFGDAPELKGLQAWVRHALLLGRPLALRADVLWAWGVAGAFLMMYLFIALVLNGALVKCAETLEQRPGKTVLAAFLTVLLTPLLFVVLSITVVGAPLLALVIGVASLIGKAAFLCWFGRRVTLALGVKHALPAVFFGGVLLLLLYVVPVLGFIVMKLTDTLGLGMVVYTMMLAGRAEKKGRPAGPVSPRADGPGQTAAAPAMGMSMGFAATPPPPPPLPAGEVAPMETQTMGAPGSGSSTSQSSSAAGVGAASVKPQMGDASVSPRPVSTVPLTSALPRAGFGIRLGSLLIDVILVFFVAMLIGQGHPYLFVPGMAAYVIALWGLKGTTIGGIICGLKVVRLDDAPLNWTTALVRGLAGFVSVLPAGLGFLWIAFDEEKQSWHDKVAGTVVVHAPKGMSLV